MDERIKIIDLPDWKRIYERNKRELFGSVIPFWVRNCIDEKYGGYFTYLDRKGQVYDTNKYMWMQWRIVYTFATLASSPYADDEYVEGIKENKSDQWLDFAKQGYEFLVEHGKDESGDYYFALNRKGDPIVAPYNIYSQAFAMMGSAALYKATGNAKYKQESIGSMERYIQRLNNPKGKWEKKTENHPQYDTLGHYMILANMAQIAEDFLGTDKYAGHIDTALDMVLNKFYNEDFGVIFENIIKTDDKIPDPEKGSTHGLYDLESCEGRHLNPGHGLEACWFLIDSLIKKLSKTKGTNITDAIRSVRNHFIGETKGVDSRVAGQLARIFEIIRKQLRFGWDTTFGGIFYFLDVLGKPHVELSWDMKLWWVHNEALIALLYAFILSDNDEFASSYNKVDDWTWSHFPDRNYGEWFGYLNRLGNPTHFLKGGRWKTLFHLPRYLMKSLELLDILFDVENVS